ncbi:NHX3 [Symbiodinium sp. CCMP2592]|nr:NHX3 [Symbiodinium sp. CCMP2592]
MAAVKRHKPTLLDPSLPSERIFSALFRGDLLFVQSASPYFDWQKVSLKYGTTLQAVVAGAIWDFDESDRKFEERMELLSWCISRGADPDQHSHEKVFGRVPLDTTDLCLAGSSARSLVRTVDTICFDDFISDCDPQALLPGRLKAMQQLLARAVDRPKCHLVVESVVGHMWAEICRDPEFADVTILSRPMTERKLRCVFLAHSVLLCHASPVFKAMLTNKAWQEGGNHRIVLDEPPAAVNTFLSLLYSGCFPEEECSCQDIVTVAEMADKYQVERMIPGLLSQMRSRMTVDNFASICSYALKYIDLALIRDCETFVQEKARQGEIRPDERWCNATHETMNFIVDTLNLYALTVKRRIL